MDSPETNIESKVQARASIADILFNESANCQTVLVKSKYRNLFVLYSTSRIPLFIQACIANSVAGLSEFDDEQVAIVGHGNAFQEIIGFMLNNCQAHQYR